MIPPIAVGFLLLVTLLLWMLIGGAGWKPKLAAIIITVSYTFAVWAALGSFTGWPTKAGLPDRGLYLGSVVVEPKKNHPGHIYVWLIPPKQHGGPLDYRPGDNEPRAYTLPYTRPDHEQTQQASQMAAAGKRVEIRTNNKVQVPGAHFHPYQLPPTIPSSKRGG